MTLSTETIVSGPYSGDGVQTAFAISFIFWDNSDIRAIKRVTATGVETVLTISTHYTLTGGSGATGTLTMLTAPATGETLTVKSARADTQLTSLPLGGKFPSTDVERMVDQSVRLIQQRAEELDRVLKFSETSPDSDVVFPDITGNASKTVRVNSAGTGLELATPTDGGDLGLPVSLGDGGTNADLSSPTAEELVRINAAGTAMETRSAVEVISQLFAKGGDIASASPLVIDTDGHYFDVTGTTGFSAMTVAIGRLFVLQFDGALTMTDGASLDLGGASITTAAGDRGVFYATAADTVQLLGWIAEGANVAAPNQATQSDIEAETNQNTYVPPDLIKNSPGVAKFWCKFDGTAAGPIAPSVDYNVVDVTDNSTGDYTVNIDTDFSGANWCATGNCGIVSAGVPSLEVVAQAAGTVQVNTWLGTGAGHAVADAALVTVAGHGDQ